MSERETDLNEHNRNQNQKQNQRQEQKQDHRQGQNKNWHQNNPEKNEDKHPVQQMQQAHELQKLQEERKQIRKEMKTLRAGLSEMERRAKNRTLTENLLAVLNLSEFSKSGASVVYAYASFGTEADTFALLETLWRRKIPTALPRVEGNEMRFYIVSGYEDLVQGYMGIPEPSEQCLPAHDLYAVVITPGLAFTKEGKRLGYGGGFYDRFFEAEPFHRKIAAAYGFQVLKDLPVQKWDVRMDQLVTDEEIVTISESFHR